MSFFLRFAISLFLAACASASAAHNLMLYSVVSDNYVSKSEIREKIEKLRRDDRNADLMLVLINPHFLDADVLSVPLPSGITISYQRDKSSSWLARDPHTWLGGLTPGSLSTILLSSTHGLSGHFIFEGVRYHLYPIDENLAVVVKDVQAPPVKPDEGALEPPPGENTPSPPPISASASSDSTPVIKILIAYTKLALTELGGPVESQSTEAIKNMNEALTSSGVGAKVELAGTILAEKAETGKYQYDLDWLRQDETVKRYRNEVKADVVIKLLGTYTPTPNPDLCGLAFKDVQNEGLAYGVVRAKWFARAGDCFAHEVGHVWGADHNLADASRTVPPLSYDHGYRYISNEPGRVGCFKTIMAYETECDPAPGRMKWVNFFSTPSLFYHSETGEVGRAPGIPIGDALLSDVVRLFNENAARVAAFR